MNGDPEGQREKSQKRQPPKPRSTIVRIFRAFKRYENRRLRKTQHQINEQMMARWTRRVGWFTLALVLVNIVTAIIFWRQLNVMQRAVGRDEGRTTTVGFGQHRNRWSD